MSQPWLQPVSRVLIIVSMLGGVVALHLVNLYPHTHLAVLYAFPTLLAAWWFAPRVALVFAVLALGGHSVDSWLDSTPVISWAAEAAAIALVSVLGISVTQQVRRQATLAEERRREVDRMGLLAEASRLFGSSLHMETVLQTVVDRTAAATGDACLLFLLDDKGSVLRLQAVGAQDPQLRGHTSETLGGTPLPLGAGVAGAVAAAGKAILLPNVGAGDLATPSRFLVERLSFNSYLAVPLRVRGDVIGVLSLGAVAGSRSFDEGDLHLAEELAALAAGSMANAKLFTAQDALIRELSETRHEREQFVSMVTHEMSSALTVLAGYAQLLSLPQERMAQANGRALERILSQTQRLTRLVDDLRDVSRIERGAFKVENGPCDLLAAVSEVLSANQATTTRHSLRLEMRCEALCGDWDYDRLAQVLNNLVRNAIKYSPKGGDVTVTVCKEGGAARVTVTDQGIGIAAGDLQRLFKPYSRLNQTPHVTGTGLGLLIAKAIVEAHGGDIEVESTPGEGSVFSFMLPGAHAGSCSRCQAASAQRARMA